MLLWFMVIRWLQLPMTKVKQNIYIAMVSSAIYDAWKASPPCEQEPYECNHECPYYHCDCWGDDPGDDENEELHEL